MIWPHPPFRRMRRRKGWRRHRVRGDPEMTAVDFEAFVGELATVSGEAIKPFFRTSLGIENKSRGGAFDPVTAADRTAEQAMRTLIREKFPTHGIIGEEFGTERGDAEFVWVLDPIDGTKSFITGVPLWGTLIALLHRGQPVLGAIHQPVLKQLVIGDGTTTTLNGRAVKTRACSRLADATLLY